ncbi:hypothetical protein L914_17998, partial [Phytophthora nicotianae]
SSASNGFVRVESLSKLNFEVVEVPRRVLEVRWTTGAGEARRTPINWKKRMIVHFGRNETESYGSVSVVHVPHGVSDHVVEVAPKAVASGANKQVTTTAGVVASVPVLNSD